MVTKVAVIGKQMGKDEPYRSVMLGVRSAQSHICTVGLRALHQLKLFYIYKN